MDKETIRREAKEARAQAVQTILWARETREQSKRAIEDAEQHERGTYYKTAAKSNAPVEKRYRQFP